MHNGFCEDLLVADVQRTDRSELRGTLRDHIYALNSPIYADNVGLAQSFADAGMNLVSNLKG